MFMSIEQEPEFQRLREARKYHISNRTVFVGEMMALTNCSTQTCRNKMKVEVENLVDAYTRVAWKSEWQGKIQDEVDKDKDLSWQFVPAFVYCMSIVSTIGYGNIVCDTATGRLVTIFYAIVGIPCTLLCLSNIGQMAASFVKSIYARIRTCLDSKSRNPRKSHLIKAKSSKSLSNVIPEGNILRDDKNNASNVSNVSSASPSLDEITFKSILRKSGEAVKRWSLPSPSVGRSRTNVLFSLLPTIPEKVVTYSEDDPTMTKCRNLTRKVSTSVDRLTDWTASQTSLELHTEFNPHDVEIPMYISVLVLISYVFIGGIVFSAWREDYDLLIGCYFCFISLSTIGFGDFVFGESGLSDKETGSETVQLVVTGLYIFLGIGIIAMCIDLMHKSISRLINEGKLGFWERFERYYGQGTKQQRRIHRLKQKLEIEDDDIESFRRHRRKLAKLKKQEARRQVMIAMRRYKIAYAMSTAWVAENPKLFPLLGNINLRRDKHPTGKCFSITMTKETEI